MTDCVRFVQAHFSELLDDLRSLCVIPAPSGHEELRADWVVRYLRRFGGCPVMDDAKNVILTFGSPSADDPCDVYIAHTDVIFPDTTPLPLSEDGSVFRCPGVGDDTANLVCLLLAARYLLETGAEPLRPVVIAANSCEEGLGNLRGVTALCDAYPVRRLITFDGSIGWCVMTAVGSHRYRVTVRTEGGHSYSDFGKPNAAACLASLIDTLYRVKVPPYGHTTYNVGMIEGGTSVNSIAQEASMLYEFRSDDRRGLDFMQNVFDRTLDAYRAMGIGIECELLGKRPCSGAPDAGAMDKLFELASGTLESLGVHGLQRTSGSTDANIPLSRGIPAACLGVITSGGGTHTREEWLDTEGLETGALFCLRMVLSSFHV